MKSPYPVQSLVAGVLLSLAALQSSVGAVELPKVQFVNGDVRLLQPNGITVPIKKGDVIHPGEKLITGDGGVAQIRASNQGVIALRKNSEIEFKPVADKFDVALNRGQVRTVTTLGPTLTGQLTVVTPQSNVKINNGDAETGIQADANGAASTFNRAHSDGIKVSDQAGHDFDIAAGQVVQSVADAAPIAVTGTTMFTPPAERPIADSTQGPDQPTVLVRTADLPPPVIADPNLAAGAKFTVPTGVARIATAEVARVTELPKIPELRADFVSINLTGADSSVNDVLGAIPIVRTHRSGSPDQILTIVTPAANSLPPASAEIIKLKPILAEVGSGGRVAAIGAPEQTLFSGKDPAEINQKSANFVNSSSFIVTDTTPVVPVTTQPTVTSVAAAAPLPQAVVTPTVVTNSFVDSATATLVNTPVPNPTVTATPLTPLPIATGATTPQTLVVGGAVQSAGVLKNNVVVDPIAKLTNTPKILNIGFVNNLKRR